METDTNTGGLADLGARVDLDRPIGELTTLRTGGPADLLVECDSTDVLVEVLRELDAAGTPVLLLGGGSNVVVSDAGFRGAVVRIVSSGLRIDGDTVVADAGVVWDDAVRRAVEAGVGGLECLSGIPGAVGATPVQNVGAYGVEVAELIRRVHLFDRRSGVTRWATPKELGFAYRTSVLKGRSRLVVLAVEFGGRADGLSAPLRYRELAAAIGAEAGERRPAAAVRDRVLALRRGKGMVLDPADRDTYSVGSFFTNPIIAAADAPAAIERVTRVAGTDAVPRYPAADGAVKLSAAWLIERAGFHKGYPAAGARARLSTKHTLALTNADDATTADILALAAEVRDGVAERFGIALEPEPVLVGVELPPAG